MVLAPQSLDQVRDEQGLLLQLLQVRVIVCWLPIAHFEVPIILLLFLVLIIAVHILRHFDWLAQSLLRFFEDVSHLLLLLGLT